ncbi:P1 family peptidase [Tepidimicrobium xylanilyticum]|uniref:L-aminopeptidase/D-esterase n=1 Tax=Tepidimicrobium xylanilyticum TaxID=1123352 RepID=A0A1H2REM6_9FIRM|nr:P1 family peptidase [Tepidimicrobium xylanilyticum]SDW17916.1 L-aminopeptidase/D-esterase [Tepidimicrobium xylanilyticum]
MEKNNNIKEIPFTNIDGIKVGHAQDIEAGTGCTVIICEEGATAGVDVRGGSPGTRETDLLNPQNLVDKIHAVMLSGGSAFGLDAASGVMKYLEERGIGFDVQITKVPIVCSAVLFDLTVGDYRVRPDFNMGYEACKNATNEECPNGNVGAGTGATIGKFLGMERAMKGGLGSYAIQIGHLKVGAIVAVNALGDIIDPDTGKILAGLLDEEGKKLIGTENIMAAKYSEKKNIFSGNTTIGVIATNGIFTKSEANKLASMAHNGYARTIRPAHSIFDGDTIFTIATGKVEADINVVGFLAARAVERAVINAIRSAESAYGLKAYRDLF